MSELSLLIERRWISKNDPEFYEIKSYLRKNKEEISELLKRFGWQLMMQPNLITVKKESNIQPSIKDQGIPGFKAKQDYVNLMILLMFLSEPSHSVIFTLEEVLAYLKLILTEEEIEADISSRYFTYSLYRTLTYMESIHLIERMDGKLKDLLDKQISVPGILYKNTGLYHHFLAEEKREEEVTSQQILYQKLYGQTVISLLPKEYEYIKKNSQQIEEDFRLICDEEIELVYGKDYAYINHSEGLHFPNENNRKDWLILRVCRKLKLGGQKTITKDLFYRILEKVRTEDSLYWTQEMVRWGNQSYKHYVTEQLIHKNFVEIAGESIKIHPAIFSMNL